MQPLQPAWCRRPGMNQVAQQAFGDQVLQQLARTRVDVERDPVMDLPAADHVGRDREVAVARIGRGADIGLIDLEAGDLAYRHYTPGLDGLAMSGSRPERSISSSMS